MKKYCFTCGAKLEFPANNKPRFCSKCGVSLESLGKTQKTLQEVEDKDDEADDEQLSVPTNISALDFEFYQDNNNKGEKLSTLMGTLDESQVGSIPSNPPPKITNEEAMEQFRKEAGQLRQNPIQKDDPA